MEVKELRDELLSAWELNKKTNDKIQEDVAEFGKGRAEDIEKLGKINDRMDEIETKLNRPSMAGPSNDVEPNETKAAFSSWLKSGNMAPEHQKALLLSNDPAAGYLAPEEYVRDIIKSVTELTPLRQMSKVMTTSSTTVQIPKRTAIAAGSWVAEAGTKTEDTSLQYGLEEITTHEVSCLIDVSNQMLEDSAFNLEAELSSEFSMALAKAQGESFVDGNGVSRPEGILTSPDTVPVVSGTTSVIDADSLIDAFYSIPDDYARSAEWLLKRSTLKTIRQLKETASGQYLWAPGIGGAAPSTILDRPYQESVDMPAEGSSTKAVLFGDFRRCFTIVDRLGLTVQRDPFTQAATGMVRFIARARVGAQVTDGAGIIVLSCGA